MDSEASSSDSSPFTYSEHENRRKLLRALRNSATLSQMCLSLGIELPEERRYNRLPVWPYKPQQNENIVKVALSRRPKRVFRETKSAKAMREVATNSNAIEPRAQSSQGSQGSHASQKSKPSASSSRGAGSALTSTPSDRKGSQPSGQKAAWKSQRQPARLEQEKEALEDSRTMKRTAQITQHRTEQQYVMAGNALTLKPRYQVDAQQLATMKQDPKPVEKRPSIKSLSDQTPPHSSAKLTSVHYTETEDAPKQGRVGLSGISPPPSTPEVLEGSLKTISEHDNEDKSQSEPPPADDGKQAAVAGQSSQPTVAEADTLPVEDVTRTDTTSGGEGPKEGGSDQKGETSTEAGGSGQAGQEEKEEQKELDPQSIRQWNEAAFRHRHRNPSDPDLKATVLEKLLQEVDECELKHLPGRQQHKMRVLAPDAVQCHNWMVVVGCSSLPAPRSSISSDTIKVGVLGHDLGRTAENEETPPVFSSDTQEVEELLRRLKVNRKILLQVLDPSLGEMPSEAEDFEVVNFGPLTQRLLKVSYIIGARLAESYGTVLDAFLMLRVVRLVREIALSSAHFQNSDVVDRSLGLVRRACITPLNEQTAREVEDSVNSISELIEEQYALAAAVAATDPQGHEITEEDILVQQSLQPLHLDQPEDWQADDLVDLDELLNTLQQEEDDEEESDNEERQIRKLQKPEGYSPRWGFGVPTPCELPNLNIRNPPIESLQKGIAGRREGPRREPSTPSVDVYVSPSLIRARLEHINELTRLGHRRIQSKYTFESTESETKVEVIEPKLISLKTYMRTLFNVRKHRLYIKYHGWPGDFHKRENAMLLPREEERLVHNSLIRTMADIRARQLEAEKKGLPFEIEDIYPNFQADKMIRDPLLLVYRNSHTNAIQKIPAHLVYYPRELQVSLPTINARAYRKRKVGKNLPRAAASMQRHLVRHSEFHHYSVTLNAEPDVYDSPHGPTPSPPQSPPITALDVMRLRPHTTREKCMLGLFLKRRGFGLEDLVERAPEPQSSEFELQEVMADDPDIVGRQPWLNRAALRIEVMTTKKLMARALERGGGDPRRFSTYESFLPSWDAMARPRSVGAKAFAQLKRLGTMANVGRVWHVPQSMFEKCKPPSLPCVHRQQTSSVLNNMMVKGQQMCFF